MSHPSISIVVLIASLAAGATASAQRATLTISGRVLPGTCTLSAPAITLDPVKASDLVTGDNALLAGALQFTGCIGVTKATLSFDGTPADGDPIRWKNTASSDAATGVSVALRAGASTGDYLKRGDSDVLVITGSTGSYPLRAGYYLAGTGGINAGQVQADVIVTAAYE